MSTDTPTHGQSLNIHGMEGAIDTGGVGLQILKTNEGSCDQREKRRNYSKIPCEEKFATFNQVARLGGFWAIVVILPPGCINITASPLYMSQDNAVTTAGIWLSTRHLALPAQTCQRKRPSLVGSCEPLVPREYSARDTLTYHVQIQAGR